MVFLWEKLAYIYNDFFSIIPAFGSDYLSMPHAIMRSHKEERLLSVV
jgi:hypothetical protein